jgi:hypothetical protein
VEVDGLVKIFIKMFLNHNNSISLQNPFVVYIVFITTNVHVYSLSTFQKSVKLLGNEKNTYSMMHQAIKWKYE